MSVKFIDRRIIILKYNFARRVEESRMRARERKTMEEITRSLPKSVILSTSELINVEVVHHTYNTG